MKLYNHSGKLTISMELPDFTFEKAILAEKKASFIGGVDEVGRGCLAGPVVAACVVFGSDFIGGNKKLEVLIRDSKKMSSEQRQKTDIWIKDNCVSYGIGEVSVGVINACGIVKATQKAVRQAVAICGKNCGINYLLLDAFYVPYIQGVRKRNQKPIIKGDNKSVSIAAASIIAKVYRDELMRALSQLEDYKNYRWNENKGYGTGYHCETINKFGVSKLHRKKFVETLLKSKNKIY